MFVLLFIILFHNAETELVRLVKLKFGGNLPLETCEQGWLFDNRPCPSDSIILTQRAVGFYYCPEGDKLFALAFNEFLKFELKNNLRKYNVVGEKIELNCSVALAPGNLYTGFAYTRVTDSSNNGIIRTYAECLWSDCILISYKEITLVKPGSETYICQFNYKVLAGQAAVDYVELLNKTIYVFMAPTNVKPDLEVKELDTPINCTADGDPSTIAFSWTCEGNGWQSEGHQLKIQNYGEYYCICTANNTIEGIIYEGLWNGTITIMAGAERRFPNGITFLTAIIAQIVQHVK